MVFWIGTKKQLQKEHKCEITNCMHCNNIINNNDVVILQWWNGTITKADFSFMHATCLIKQVKQKDDKFFQKMVADSI